MVANVGESKFNRSNEPIQRRGTGVGKVWNVAISAALLLSLNYAGAKLPFEMEVLMNDIGIWLWLAWTKRGVTMKVAWLSSKKVTLAVCSWSGIEKHFNRLNLRRGKKTITMLKSWFLVSYCVEII